jgi:RimJ/RimL family protein N-acetyltransferase
MAISTTGVYLLSLEHVEAIQRLASDAAIAATTRIPHPYPASGARDFITRQLAETAEGTGQVFVIKDRQEVVGLCGLHGIDSEQARELGFWVGRPFWGKGYASLGVKMMLQFAFQNLRLARVGSSALESNAASRRVLEKSGFRLLRLERHDDPLLKRPDELLASYEITRLQWQEVLNAPALAALHPALQAILRAEIAAGNEVAETGGGWPDGDSVFVRLRQPFHTRPSVLPEGVQYTELNDPHWWKAEFSTRSPRHILAY